MNTCHPVQKKVGKRHGTDKRSRGLVVPAFLFSSPDLACITSLQNLLGYCLDSVLDITRHQPEDPTSNKHYMQCVRHIERLYQRRRNDFNGEVCRLLVEFIEEAKLIGGMIRDMENVAAKNILSAKIPIAAKATRLQWLSICLQEELRQQLVSSKGIYTP